MRLDVEQFLVKLTDLILVVKGQVQDWPFYTEAIPELGASTQSGTINQKKLRNGFLHWAAVAEELEWSPPNQKVGRSILSLLLSACQSFLGQDTEPLNGPPKMLNALIARFLG